MSKTQSFTTQNSIANLHKLYFLVSTPQNERILRHGSFCTIWRLKKHLKLEVLIVLFWKLRGVFPNVAILEKLALVRKSVNDFFFLFKKQTKRVGVRGEERDPLFRHYQTKTASHCGTILSSKTAQYKQSRSAITYLLSLNSFVSNKTSKRESKRLESTSSWKWYTLCSLSLSDHIWKCINSLFLCCMQASETDNIMYEEVCVLLC